MSKYDLIVIGGGHNGLTAATILARSGKKVLVLEKRDITGGIAAGEEFHPGYRTNGLLSDTSTVRTAVIKDLELEKFGLRTTGKRAPYTVFARDGRSITISADDRQTAAEIAKISEKDAKAYLVYRSFIDKISDFISGIMNDIPPDVMHLNNLGNFWEIAKKGMELKRLGDKTMLEILRVAPMPVADFLNELFETDFLKAGLAGPSIYGSWTGPYSAYTNINLLIWECLAKEQIIGGPQALVTALEKAAKAAGAEIRTGAEVSRILLTTERRVRGVLLADGTEIETEMVASSATFKDTFLKLIKSNELDYSFESLINNFRSRGTTAKVNLALKKKVKFFNNGSDLEFVRTGNSLDDLEKAFDSVKYREFSQEPVLEIHVPTYNNSGLAPEGHSVVSVLVHFAPYVCDKGWDKKQKDALLKTVLKTLGQYIPDLADSIAGSEVQSPLDLEKIYSLTEGHIFHGEHALDQVMVRPVPDCVHYKTPVEGLYLCGSSSHPGGGITCAPGAFAAKAILNPPKAVPETKEVLQHMGKEITTRINDIEPKTKKRVLIGGATSLVALSGLFLFLRKK